MCLEKAKQARKELGKPIRIARLRTSKAIEAFAKPRASKGRRGS